MISSNNKRLAKNSILLYFRMGLTMIISLISARIVLNTLGVADYGVYSVVGGFVVLFSFLNQSLSTVTQRYFAVALGEKDDKKLLGYYNSSIIIYLGVVLIVFILAETIGLWFLNNKMSFPANRSLAIFWVYQLSILTTVVGILKAPLDANVIANERMSFFAYTSIFEAVLKVLVLFLLVSLSFDKLIVYSALILSVTILITTWYSYYNRKEFNYARFKIEHVEKKYLIELLSFTSWGMLGSIASLGFRQGVNVIINIFYGVTVNAAFGIANQVSAMFSQFASGFQIALNPQLTKAVAAKEKDHQNKLIYRSSKFSYFLLFFIGLPVLLNMEFLLTLWLKTVPDYTVIFCQLIIIGTLVDVISAPFWVVVFATGKIKLYQIIVSTIIICNVIFSYIAAKYGYEPELTLYIRIGLFAIQNVVRVIFVSQLIDFDIIDFLKKVLIPIIFVTIIASPLPILLKGSFTGVQQLISTSVLSAFLVVGCVYFIGLDRDERVFLKLIVVQQTQKFIFRKK
ncbi:oligosaccharide flippase family protein [Labilibaculum manganireducens]|uniref:lipopolysaccharide biosynthesis protein n=1 Tax=Labilibaculum manganireducens TaxID=1940525 RepID=UPI0029F57397|nr:oligosaccharide flippase family protein [Labilibaculum manganireducens]